MTPRAVRRLVLIIFVTGIGGMILGSILDNNGVAITFGLVTATAALGLILVTMVTPPEAFRPDGAVRSTMDRSDDEQAGAQVEEQVEKLTAAGADEHDVRELVRRSIDFGRGRADP